MDETYTVCFFQWKLFLPSLAGNARLRTTVVLQASGFNTRSNLKRGCEIRPLVDSRCLRGCRHQPLDGTEIKPKNGFVISSISLLPCVVSCRVCGRPRTTTPHVIGMHHDMIQVYSPVTACLSCSLLRGCPALVPHTDANTTRTKKRHAYADMLDRNRKTKVQIHEPDFRSPIPMKLKRTKCTVASRVAKLKGTSRRESLMLSLAAYTCIPR